VYRSGTNFSQEISIINISGDKLGLQNQCLLKRGFGFIRLGDAPNITKATVTGYLGAYPSRQTLMTAMQKLRSSDADTRRQALPKSL
jgi:hypothetical protein